MAQKLSDSPIFSFRKIDSFLIFWSLIYFKVYPNPLKTCSYLGNPNLADMVDVGRIIFHRGPGPIKRTNTKGTQVLIWNGKIIDPSANTEESGELDRSVCSLITQGKNRSRFLVNIFSSIF